jgi:hypothetical protein
MKRKIFVLSAVLVMALMATTAVFAGGPDGPPGMPGRLYVDDALYATRGLTALPAPNANNIQSFDKLYVVTNGVSGQPVVGEAAPGDQDFNGGRWDVQTVTWTDESQKELLTSDAQIFNHLNAGHLTVADGSFAGGPPDNFECPVIPLRGL